jgi:diguanylate cyclase (GGDEF)-like protein/PAS domain S-box-containing protein
MRHRAAVHSSAVHRRDAAAAAGYPIDRHTVTDLHPDSAPAPLALTAEQVLGAAPDPFFALDHEARVLYANAAAERVTGISVTDIAGRLVWDAFPGAHGSVFEEQYRRSVDEGTTVAFTAFYPPLERWFAVQAVPQPTGTAVFCHDVTAAKEAERRAERLASVHRALQRAATVVATNGGPEQVFSLVAEDSAELVDAGGSWLVTFDGGDYEVLASSVPAGRGRPGAGDRVRVHPGSEIARVRDGETITVPDATDGRLAELGLRSAVLVPIRLGGAVWGCLAVAWEERRSDAAACEPLLRDFADLVAVALDNAAARSELARQAADDPLTGLANLRTLHRELDARVDAAASDGRPLCLALVDVDHFKSINDGHGHDVGDTVLRAVGRRIAAACGPGELAARIGGDEFALVLHEDETRSALQRAQRLRDDLAAARADDGLPPVTASIGVCAWEPGLDREGMQRRADDALYWAKLHGRNAVWAYNDELMDVRDARGRAAALRRTGESVDPTEIEAGLRSAKAFWQSALDGLRKQIAILDGTGRIVAANAAWRRYATKSAGRPRGTGVGADYLAACEGSGDPVALEIARALREVADGRREHFEVDYPCHCPEGDRWYTLRANRFGGDERGRVIVTNEDITARRSAEEQSAFQATLLDFVAMPVYATDLDDRVTYWNHAAEQLNGLSSEEVLGRRIDALGLIDPSSVDPRDEHAAVAAPELWEGELAGVRPDGRTFPAFVTRAVVRDADGYRTGVIGTVFDMSEREAYERDLQAARDYLHTVTESIADGLVVFDAAGTVTYANRAARELLRAEDGLAGMPVASALYGDRPHPLATDVFGQERAADDVFRRRDGTALHVEWTAASLDVPDAAVADGAKIDTAGSRVLVFRDVTEHRAREERLRREAEGLRWAARLQEALDEDRFVLHAQPIVATDTGRTVDHELLIRLRDEDGGFIPPGDFLPAAEELGAIVDIDRWVTGQAVRCAAEGMRVHFNLSARTIGDETILQILRTGLAESGADAGRLTVEVTETALIDDCGNAASFIAQLRGMGCHVALDDFGTGYNGLGRMKDIDADIIKIDRQFVGDLMSEPASESVVKAILAFADDMGLGIIAEGVEDEETAQRLCELGVPHAQGFHFGRPGPMAWTAPVAPGSGD